MELRTRLYPEPFDYTNAVRSNEDWPDHRLRALVSGAMLAWMQPTSVLDVACGDASIVRYALGLPRATGGIQHVYLNDISKAQIESLKVAAGFKLALIDTKLSNLPVDELLQTITGKVDVIVMTEILEHVEDPDLILRLAATKTDQLLVSSPEMRTGQIDSNPEHLWMFDGQGYETMLVEAGWRVVQKTHLTFRSEYDFQIHVADRP